MNRMTQRPIRNEAPSLKDFQHSPKKLRKYLAKLDELRAGGETKVRAPKSPAENHKGQIVQNTIEATLQGRHANSEAAREAFRVAERPAEPQANDPEGTGSIFKAQQELKNDQKDT